MEYSHNALILMSLFSNFNICVRLGLFPLADLPPCGGSYILASLHGWLLLYWIPDMVNFTLLGAGWLCIAVFLSFVLGCSQATLKQFDYFGSCF